MEFDEMKKIWNTQNNEPMYAINEAALHKRIQAKKHRASRTVNLTEIGLIIINIITPVVLLFKTTLGNEPVNTYLLAAFMASVAGYLIISRIRRKQQENQFDRSMLGDLNYAIANANYQVIIARKVLWWYFLPIAAISLLSFQHVGSVLIILVAVALAFLLGKWELNRCHLPRKRELEDLRNTLTKEEVEQV